MQEQPTQGLDIVELGEQITASVAGTERELRFNLGAWAILEAKYGRPDGADEKARPSLSVAIRETLNRLLDPSAGDLMFITWAAVYHLGNDRPSFDQVADADLAAVFGWQGLLLKALLRDIPKAKAPGLTAPGAQSGTGMSSSTSPAPNGGSVPGPSS